MIKPPLHRPFGLFAQLAKAMGIDLLARQKSGDLAPDTARRMQNHCAACSDPSTCRHLLHHENYMDNPPAFCPNGKLLMSLRDATREDP